MSIPTNPLDQVIVPLDGMDAQQAITTVAELRGLGITWFKVGKSLINRGDGGVVHRAIKELGGKTFWDNKDRDITNTMVDGAIGARELGVNLFNVYADAGTEKLVRVAQVPGRPTVAGVTVLTDMNDEDCFRIYGDTVAPVVGQLAANAEGAGLEALICSARDLPVLERAGAAQNMTKITPGIRPLWAAANDQKRVATPFWAILNGADMLVIGRPITTPPDDVGSIAEAVRLLEREIREAKAARRYRERLCQHYFETGSVQFGEFELSAHRDNPALEKSPIYLHYPASKDDWRMPELYDTAAALIDGYMTHCVRAEPNTYIAGVPRGALPLAEAYVEEANMTDRLLVFGKEQQDGGGTVFTGPDGNFDTNSSLIWIEDHTSGGRNKLIAKEAAEDLGFAVEHMLTVVDRQQGGVEQMRANGVELHSLLTLDQLLSYGLREGYVDTFQVEKVQDYIERNQLWPKERA